MGKKGTRALSATTALVLVYALGGGTYVEGVTLDEYDNIDEQTEQVDDGSADNGVEDVWVPGDAFDNLLDSLEGEQAVPVNDEEAAQEYDVTWEGMGAGTATITGYNGAGGAITVPETVDGMQVAAIGVNAYQSRNITEVVIPVTVTGVGDGAFTNNPLTRVTIENGNATVSSSAFDGGNTGVIIVSGRGTAVHDYAKDNGYTFESIDGGDDEVPGEGEVEPPIIEDGENTEPEPEEEEVDQPGEGNEGTDDTDNTGVEEGNVDKEEGAEDAVNEGESLKPLQMYAQQGELDSDFEVQNNGDGTGEITWYYGESEILVIPSIVGGLQITGIGDRAFNSTEGIREVTIPDTVQYLGDWSFAYGDIEKVTLSKNLKSIGSSAFYENQLTTVDIPDSVLRIEDEAFYRNNITSIRLSNQLQVINYRIVGDNPITHLELPNSVTTITKHAFTGNKFSSIKLSNSLTKIGSMEFIGHNITQITIPDSVTEIGDSAFENNQITTLILSKNLKEIGESVFKNNLLTGVDLPQGLENIGYEAFAYNAIGTVEIPNNVTQIEDMAFMENQLTSVTIPGSVKDIMYGAFSGNKITELTLAEGLENIGGTAFSENNLTEVTLPESVMMVDFWAFRKNAIETFIVPSSGTILDDGVLLENKSGTSLMVCGADPSSAKNYANLHNHTFEVYPECEDLGKPGEGLSLYIPRIDYFDDIKLTGKRQEYTTSFWHEFTVYKETKVEEGWRLDVSSTQFEEEEPWGGFAPGTSAYKLPPGSLLLAPVDTIERYDDGGGLLPTGNLLSNTVIDNGVVTVVSADRAVGKGDYDLVYPEEALTLVIDGSTALVDNVNYPNGTPYEATITWNLISAP